jgi:hypothetical protein
MDTRLPVAITDITKTLEVVLFNCEVPHKIAPVHPTELVAHEVFDISSRVRIFSLFQSSKIPVHAFLVTFCAIIPGSWEKVSRFHTAVVQLPLFTCDFVFIFSFYIDIA